MKSTQIDWRDLPWPRINSAHDDMRARLEQQNGTLWKEVVTELHSPNLEMPFWILLYEDGDIEQAHSAFKSVVQAHTALIAPVQCTVAYVILTETAEISVDFLNDTSEILAAPQTRKLALYPDSAPRSGHSIFETQVSGKRP